MDLCIIKKLSPVDLVPVFTQVQTGTHIGDARCVTYVQTEKIKIFAVNENETLNVDFDGEEGNTLPLEIEVIPKTLNLLVPKNGRNIKKVI